MEEAFTDIRGSVSSRLLQQFWLCEGLSASDLGRLLVLPGRVLTDMLDSSPGLLVWWLRRVTQAVGDLLAELKADAGQSAAQRIVRWLLAKVGAHSGETRIRHDISKSNLAASLNTTPESFSRVLKHLRQEGLVRVEGRDIVVPNPTRLRYLLQPCAFCRKPGPENAIETPDERSEWERLVALRSKCDVPQLFGGCDCDDAMPHWQDAV